MVNIARRRSRPYRYRTRTRTIVRRSRSSGGKYKGLIDGILAGAGATLIKKYVNVPFADDLAIMGVGIWRKNSTLTTIGAIGLGSDLVGVMPGGTTNGGYIG